MKHRSLAARAGRWSAQHRKKAIGGWFLFVILATVIGGAVGQKSLADEDMGNGESQRGDRIVKAADFPDQTGESVLVQGRNGLKTTDPQYTAVVRDVVSQLEQTKGVRKIENPLEPRYAGNVSKDGRSMLVNFQLPGDLDAAEKLVDASLATTAALQRAHPKATIAQFGDASADKGLSNALDDDFKKAEFLSLPITLAILLVAFGALVAAAASSAASGARPASRSSISRRR